MCSTRTARSSPYVYGVPASRATKIERHYNIAPSQPVPAIRADADGRRIDLLRWGLIPFWAEDAKIGNSLINARGEAIAEKPAFREAFKRRRCVLPASHFYEWQKLPGSKVRQPYCVSLASGELMSFAGLWETWRNPQGELVESYSIVTTEANDMMARLHDRMPLMLTKDDCNAWLDLRASREALQALIRPYPADEMRAWR